MASPQFSNPMPEIPDDIVKVSFPAEHVIHVAMNRPKQYNAMNQVLEKTMDEVFNWFEAEPELWVAILGSTNKKAWCAGQDLKEMVSGRTACFYSKAFLTSVSRLLGGTQENTPKCSHSERQEQLWWH